MRLSFTQKQARLTHISQDSKTRIENFSFSHFRYYHDSYDRGREYSPRRRSPGGYYSPPRRGDRPRRSPSPGKGGIRRRFVHDIPPESEQERRDR